MGNGSCPTLFSLFDSSPPKEVCVQTSATDATKDLATDQKFVKIVPEVAAIARKVTISFAKVIATFPNTTTTFAKEIISFTKVVNTFAKVDINFAKDATTFTKVTTTFTNFVAKFAKVTATFAKEVITFVKEAVTFGTILVTFEPRAARLRTDTRFPGGKLIKSSDQNFSFRVSVQFCSGMRGEGSNQVQ